MHEHGMMDEIFKKIELIAKQNKLSKINKIKLRIGQNHQVKPDLLLSAFEHIANAHKKAEGAKLEYDITPTEVKCRSCANEFTMDEQAGFCPSCDGVDLDIMSGRDVVIESVEGEKSGI